MEFDKKISVIVPVHNTRIEFIALALKSLLEQTYKNLEIIVVDDGSTEDSTLSFLKSFKNPKVKLIFQKCGGPGHARNTGLLYATGDYIGFLDSDDWVSSNFYEVILTLCEKYKADIACALLIRKDGDLEKTINKVENIVTSNLLKKLCYITNGSDCDKLFRKELISDIRFDEGVLYEDNVFFDKKFNKKSKCCIYGQYKILL